MDVKETKEAIKVMQHYADGGEVEHMMNGRLDNRCAYPDWTPDWHWNSCNYRIKKRSGECWVVISGNDGLYSTYNEHPGAIKIRWEEI